MRLLNNLGLKIFLNIFIYLFIYYFFFFLKFSQFAEIIKVFFFAVLIEGLYDDK